MDFISFNRSNFVLNLKDKVILNNWNKITIDK